MQMNSRSGIFGFFLFLFLLAIVLLQVLSMVQSDRLYERINRLSDAIETLSRSEGTVSSQPTAKTETLAAAVKPSDLPQYPGEDGDWLIFALGAEPRTLNQISVDSETYSRWIVSGNIQETLLEYDLDTMKLKPLLAEWYRVSDDGLEITFRLKDNIRFSNGKPITTEDIQFTYNTIMDPGIDAPDLRNYYFNIKEFVVIDDHTCKFVCKEPYWKALEMVSGMNIIPKSQYQYKTPQEFNQRRSEPVGSGPYVFEKWDVGREIVLRRNENYWGKKPRLEKVIFRFITNDVATLQALRSHDVDMIIPTPDQYFDVASQPDFQKEFYALKYWSPGTPYFWIGWNEKTPFFNDKRVRLAMTYIIDRQAIVRDLLKGNAEIVTGPFYLYGPQNDPDIKPWPYDPEQAKKLLAEAGWRDTDGDGVLDKDGVKFHFRYTYPVGRALYEQIAKLLKDGASKVGIEVEPEPAEWSIFTNRINDRQFEAATMGWGGAINDDPYQIWHSSQIEGRGNNFISFRNAEADRIIEEARRTLDEKKRNLLYFQFDRIIHEEQPYTFLFTRPTFRFVDRRFQNIIVHKLGVDPLEWYVPKGQQRYH
jgi:peptide/nickel transport system substrate-binding protein